MAFPLFPALPISFGIRRQHFDLEPLLYNLVSQSPDFEFFLQLRDLFGLLCFTFLEQLLRSIRPRLRR
jgi:hypothetical protein